MDNDLITTNKKPKYADFVLYLGVNENLARRLSGFVGNIFGSDVVVVSGVDNGIEKSIVYTSMTKKLIITVNEGIVFTLTTHSGLIKKQTCSTFALVQMSKHMKDFKEYVCGLEM